MSIEVTNKIPEDLWSAFVQSKRSSNIFHTQEMFEVFSRTKNYKPELWAAVQKGRILALMLPVNISLCLSPFLKKITSRAVAFGSILIEDGRDGEEGLVQLLSIYSREAGKKVLFTELRNVSDLSCIKSVMHKSGYIFEDHLNYLIYLDRYPEKVFSNIGARTRKNIKRALRKNIVQIETIEDMTKMEECYQLLKKTYRRAAVPLADISLFQAAFEILLPKKMLMITLAKVNDQPAAVSFDLLFKKTIIGWYGGTDRKYKSYLPNELLTWHLLKWGCENGYEVYDFGGAGKPQTQYGVREFKAKFGGQKVNFGRFKIVHSKPLFFMAAAFYEILRPVIYKFAFPRKM